jgi:hypothetical protein
VVDRLSSLGINFDFVLEHDGRLIYNFYNVEKIGRADFLLSAKDKEIIYQAAHFGEGKFEEPGSGIEAAPDELSLYLSKKFPKANNIILSCCNPDQAKIVFGNANNKVIFIGVGSNNYSTFYYDKEKKLSSVRNIK